MDATATRAQPPASSADAAREVVLRTEGLTKVFARRTAVNHLGLEVRRGDVFGLLGPNGSGKTTTLRMILGLVWPTAGEVFLFGQSTANGDHRRAALKRIGAIAEQPAFYPFLSGRDNLLGVATFSGLPADDATRARVREVLEQVGLAPRAGDAYKKYSLGMKQRLGIGATLLTHPDLIVLDEPTNGLDPAGMVEVRTLISQLAESGVTVLLSSHLLYEVQQVCTRVGILKEGVLLAQGEVADLLLGSSGIVLGFTAPEQLPQAAALLLNAAAGEASWLRSVQYVLPEPGAWTPPGGWLLRVDAPAEHAADVNRLLAAQGIYAAEVRRAEGSLEQYFLALTGAPSPPQPQAPASPVAQPQGGPA